jgi:hypothetical protein
VRIAAVNLLLLVVPSARSAAQTNIPVERGAPVRVRSIALSVPDQEGVCEGRVPAIRRDTLLLGRPFGCPKGSYLARVRVARGNHGSRLAHVGLGLLLGGLAGGVIARIAVDDRCTVGDCTDNRFAAAIKTVFGATLGGATGLTVGVLLPAGPRWVDVGVRPVQVGAFILHPGLQVSAAGGVRR